MVTTHSLPRRPVTPATRPETVLHRRQLAALPTRNIFSPSLDVVPR
ncbi:hypothetical protein I546_5429 [Mycobacterium kansasii 732]|nr:hypothetical protein I546_5429 [Mycobacterium kansasii 732]